MTGKTGRPSKLSPERTTRLVDLIAAGNYPEVAAQAVGIGPSTYYEWMAKGREGRSDYVEFAERIKKARAEAENRNLLIIAKAAETTWQAAAWILERTHPDRYALHRKDEITGSVCSEPSITKALKTSEDYFASLEANTITEGQDTPNHPDQPVYPR